MNPDKKRKTRDFTVPHKKPVGDTAPTEGAQGGKEDSTDVVMDFGAATPWFYASTCE